MRCPHAAFARGQNAVRRRHVTPGNEPARGIADAGELPRMLGGELGALGLLESKPRTHPLQGGVKGKTMRGEQGESLIRGARGLATASGRNGQRVRCTTTLRHICP
eukprot:scaffold22045_cov111-Isochrysis_galbana.AAC.4